MGRTVAVVCPKGGVGKTTVSVNLGSALAEKGFDCLLVGLDPQCGLQQSLGHARPELETGLLDLFEQGGDPAGAIQASPVANLSFMTSHVRSRQDESRLTDLAAADPGRLSRLLAACRDRFDFLFLDCPPNLGPLTFAALRAANAYLVPLQPEVLAQQALPRLFRGVAELSRQGLPAPELLGILLNQVDSRTRLANTLVDRIRDEYGDQVFKTMVPRTVRLGEVPLRGLPVDRFNRSGTAASAFVALADEILAPIVEQAVEDRSMAAAGQGVGIASADELLETYDEVTAPTVGATLLTGEIRGEGLRDATGAGSTLSLEEIPEMEEAVVSRSRPNLDDYDESGEDDYRH